MRRRALLSGALLCIPTVTAQQDDPWQRFEEVWNPFAKRMNDGVLDLKLWEKVKRAFVRLGGCAR